jgi:hypothetical protein
MQRGLSQRTPMKKEATTKTQSELSQRPPMKKEANPQKMQMGSSKKTSEEKKRQLKTFQHTHIN